MLVSYYRPKQLSRKRLDHYLAAGWFRSSNGLFRARSIFLDGGLCTVLNIRTELTDFRFSKKQRKLLNRNCNRFHVDIAPLEVCGQMEDLYQQAKSKFKGFVFPDLNFFLNDADEQNPFDSWHVKVYDQDKLVAASVFDQGERSLMSVLGLYDEDYRQHSLGIFTMLKEIEYGAANGFRFYYPGFILEENPYFNYKLAVGNFSFLKENQRWVKQRHEAVNSALNPRILGKMNEFEQHLKEAGIQYRSRIYKFYPIAYVNPGMELYRFPLVLEIGKGGRGRRKLATYDHELDMFRLDQVQNLEEPWFFAEDNDRLPQNHEISCLLGMEKPLLQSRELSEIIDLIRESSPKGKPKPKLIFDETV